MTFKSSVSSHCLCERLKDAISEAQSHGPVSQHPSSILDILKTFAIRKRNTTYYNTCKTWWFIRSCPFTALMLNEKELSVWQPTLFDREHSVKPFPLCDVTCLVTMKISWLSLFIFFPLLQIVCSIVIGQNRSFDVVLQEHFYRYILYHLGMANILPLNRHLWQND